MAKKREPWGFCETPEENCTMNYCDENGCQNRKREGVDVVDLIDGLRVTSEINHRVAWLLEKPNHVLDGHGLSSVVKVLITKHNALVEIVKQMNFSQTIKK